MTSVTTSTTGPEPQSANGHHASTSDDLAAARSKIENLEIALRSSRVIGTAIGILVERHKISVELAFDMMVRLSQHTHRKLHDIASDLVFTGELPTDAR